MADKPLCKMANGENANMSVVEKVCLALGCRIEDVVEILPDGPEEKCQIYGGNGMQILDNVNTTVRDDLKKTLKKGSRVSIAAACFSIYAYQELKHELKNVEELRFIFTSPTFIKEKTPKASREFYIPRLNREKSLYGTEFEVKLRNELTQKAIAKECADQISRKGNEIGAKCRSCP